MKIKLFISVLLLTGIVALVHGLNEQAHEFLQSECSMCHVNVKKDPSRIMSFVTAACDNCHRGVKETQSHPTDIHATFPIPEDMPLTDGKITCITCHYVHPKKGKQLIEKHYFLRRMVRGPLFCNICHEINERGHIVAENVHSGSFKVTDRASSIDRMSLGCIECHDSHFKDPMDFLGAGTWQHYSKMSHPIGIEYDKAIMKKMSEYRPAAMLRKEIILYDGKIGCGTCHSIYSQNRAMMVVDNYRSKLCRECHLK